jgi:hypothetical protein
MQFVVNQYVNQFKKIPKNIINAGIGRVAGLAINLKLTKSPIVWLGLLESFFPAALRPEVFQVGRP